MSRDPVRLVNAAGRLRLSYRATMDAILRGELRGWQDDRGRWFVDRCDLDRLVRKRARKAEERAGEHVVRKQDGSL